MPIWLNWVNHTRTDVTNRDVSRTRNRIRHELLPLLREDYNEKVDRAVLRLADRAGEVQDEIDDSSANSCRLPWKPPTRCRLYCVIDRLATTSPYLRRQLLVAVWRVQQWPLQAMGFYAMGPAV